MPVQSTEIAKVRRDRPLLDNLSNFIYRIPFCVR